MKCCTKCGVEKPLTEFAKDSSKASGIRASCKVCSSKQATDWNKSNKDRYASNLKRWREANPERARDIDKRHRDKNREKRCQVSKTWVKNNPAKHNANTSAYRARVSKAIPSWFERDAIAVVYDKAKEFGFEVDHIVPLKGKTVCGLHCWSNLQLLDKSMNSSKREIAWPDMPE